MKHQTRSKKHGSALTAQSTIVVCLLTLLVTGVPRDLHAATGGSKVLPGRAHPYGQSLAEWFTDYSRWLLSGVSGPEQFGHVFFPASAGSATGSGTLADPLVVTGHGDFTVEAGTAFVTPLGAWNSEIYVDGSVDPVLPDSWWGTYFTLDKWTIDGKQVVALNNASSYYVPPQYLDPPILYLEPSPSGAVGTVAIQGWAAVIPPLSVGTHTLESQVSFMIPADNDVFPGFELGLVLNFTSTITVVPHRK